MTLNRAVSIINQRQGETPLPVGKYRHSALLEVALATRKSPRMVVMTVFTDGDFHYPANNKRNIAQKETVE